MILLSLLMVFMCGDLSVKAKTAIQITGKNTPVYSDDEIIGYLRTGEIFNTLGISGNAYTLQLENSFGYIHVNNAKVVKKAIPNYTTKIKTGNQIYVTKKINVTNANGRTLFVTQPFRRYHYISETKTHYIISVANVKGYVKKSEARIDKGIPVLTYHALEQPLSKENFSKGTYISTSQFEKNMKYLYQNGYKTIHITDLYNYLGGRKNLGKKVVVITFDDGIAGTYTQAYPILNKYKQKATQFLITERINKYSSTLTVKQINTMNNVFSYQGHTHDMHRMINNQAELTISSIQKIRKDLQNSKKILKNQMYFAYPFGKYTNNSITALKQENFRLAFTVQPNYITTKSNHYLLPRFSVYPNTSDLEFAEMVMGEYSNVKYNINTKNGKSIYKPTYVKW